MLNEVNKSALTARVTKRGNGGGGSVAHSADDGDASDDVHMHVMYHVACRRLGMQTWNTIIGKC